MLEGKAGFRLIFINLYFYLDFFKAKKVTLFLMIFFFLLSK